MSYVDNYVNSLFGEVFNRLPKPFQIMIVDSQLGELYKEQTMVHKNYEILKLCSEMNLPVTYQYSVVERRYASINSNIMLLENKLHKLKDEGKNRPSKDDAID